jgi:ATP-dependent protease ClpP protease subunit
MPNWGQVLQEIRETKDNPPKQESSHDVVRRKYLKKLRQKTGRNVIAYYSGFLQKPKIQGIEITDEDKNAFMLCIHGLDRSKGLDLMLHTPGGDGEATQSLVHYLKEMFGNDIRAIVPQIAMSAGTLIACACKEIVMGKHSNLGPIDPQFGGIAAIGVLKEIDSAFKEIKEDQRASLIWNPILGRLTPSFVQQCHWAIERSRSFASSALLNGMFADLPSPQKEEVVEKIVQALADLAENRTHNRHFHYQDCQRMGLKIEMLEQEGHSEFQDLVLTVHHCFMHTLANTVAIKITESHRGLALIKNQNVQAQAQQLVIQVPNAPPQQPAQ